MSETEIQALQLAVKAILSQLGPTSAAVVALNKAAGKLQIDPSKVVEWGVGTQIRKLLEN